MCQLLGMNCAKPTDFSFSLRGFCKRGGDTDIHSHGWGICVYEERIGGVGLRSFHDTLSACTSPIATMIQQYPMRTHNMMAHIRYATQGEVTLENVHPFVRVWKGIQMCFAHNGECPQYNCINRIVLVGKAKEVYNINDVPYHPVGDTDSESVFCSLLNAMSAEFPNGLPTLPVLFEFLQEICNEIIQQHIDYMKYIASIKNECVTTGTQMPLILNFLLGCGPYTLFAFSMPGQRPGSKVWNGLHYIIREPPFTVATLVDDDYMIDFNKVTTQTDRVAVIATVPLTTENGWTQFTSGQLILFDNGIPHLTPESCYNCDCIGHGLVSKTVTVKYTQLKNATNANINSKCDTGSTSMSSTETIDATNTTTDATNTTTDATNKTTDAAERTTKTSDTTSSPETETQKQQIDIAENDNDDDDSNNSQSERRDDDIVLCKQQQSSSSSTSSLITATMITDNYILGKNNDACNTNNTNINTDTIVEQLSNILTIDRSNNKRSPSSSITDISLLN